MSRPMTSREEDMMTKVDRAEADRDALAAVAEGLLAEVDDLLVALLGSGVAMEERRDVCEAVYTLQMMLASAYHPAVLAGLTTREEVSAVGV